MARETRFGLFVAVLSLGLGLSLCARSQDAGDVVELTNGGRLRGSVLVYEPGAPVVIRLPTGETRTIPPAEVAAVELAGRERSVAPPTTDPPVDVPSAPAAVESPAVAENEPSPTSVPAVAADAEPWVLEDGRADEVPWDDYDDGIGYAPRGALHVGAFIDFGLSVPPLYGSVGLGAFVEVRPIYNAAWRPRLAGIASFGFGLPDVVSSVRIRALPVAVDLDDLVALRLGADVGGRHGPANSSYDFRWEVVAGPTLELGLTLLEGHLELGLRASLLVRDYQGYSPGAVLELALFAGGVL